MSKEKLLPCPFCGGEANLNYFGGESHIPFYQISCNECGCKQANSIHKEVVINAWNTRKPTGNEDLEEQRMNLKLPVKIGSTVYVICECENIPPQLDGTLYGANGGVGTATGYYCPYEDSCPHECMDCDDFDCEKYEDKPAVFEDTVASVMIDEFGFTIATKKCRLTSYIGEYIFLTKEEAEQALKQMGE